MLWVNYNPSPTGRRVGDCAIRAIAKALDTDWDTSYVMLVLQGFIVADLPSSDAVWGAVLRHNGFSRHAIPNTCPDNYTAAEFAVDNPEGIYVLGFGGHVATVVNGNLYDSWDSSQEIPQFYWVKD